MTLPIDFSGSDLVANGVYVGASTPGSRGTLLSGSEITVLDGVTAGTGTASKAMILDAGEDFTWPATGLLTYGGTQVTANGAELNYLDIASLGTGAASKAVVLSATGTYTGPTAATTKLTWSVTSDSTDGGTSVEPFVHNTTMTGVGGVGGRAHFTLTTNVALGNWSNALKGEATYGASGKTTGLGSAIVAEMTLSAGTADGTYAPLELELNLGTGALTGTSTSLIYASVNGADKATFDTNGYFATVAGVTAGTSKMFANNGTITNVNELTHGLKVSLGGADYYLVAVPAATFTS